MSKSRGNVYIPSTVEVTIKDEVRKFKVTVDGTIYSVKETKRPARTMSELMVALTTTKKPPYMVTRETLKRVKNPTLQKVVFLKYLENLQNRIAQQKDTEAEKGENSDASVS